ncbi:YitT family protein [Carnobacterium gallinarum]|uniref:YitT family protein n=1 Tax=Carnobacterium gallinarum TaxID=2749 RepID=UPI001B80A7F7|nr:YitT family protein [Carnobacterium gallinarum]
MANKRAMKAIDILYVLVGAFFIALAVNCFFLPNHIVSGGVSGLSVVLNYQFGWQPSVLLFAINVPLLILCFVCFGVQAGLKTILGSMILPVYVALTSQWSPITDNPLLAALFGGILAGLGIGIVFKGNASTGGTGIIALIIHKYLRLPMGGSVALIDGLIVLSALLVFNVETVMYSLISLFIISRVIDLVQVGFNRSKNVMIISTSIEEIKKQILTELDRGVTNIAVRGGYGNNEQEMLMCVIPEREFNQLKETVLEIDSHAFVVVMSASEVMGRGFSLLKE